MSRRSEALKARTKTFALDVLSFVDSWATWLECADARQLGKPSQRTYLLGEANELTAIVAASSVTVTTSLTTSHANPRQ